MDALVSHGCLIVDLTDGGTSFELAKRVGDMWKTVEGFFQALESDPDQEVFLPPMSSIEASPFAKIGYANYENGLKFMETRLDRQTNQIMPAELVTVVGKDGVVALRDAFELIADAGKDVVRIATAASTWENKGFSRKVDAPSISGVSFAIDDEEGDGDEDEGAALAAQAALKMVRELVDDGRKADANVMDGDISMSPHRLCYYSNGEETGLASHKEVFGAHTDSSFVTMVPVAAIAGLEIFDEGSMQWYRPELYAREQWRKERILAGQDPDSDLEEMPGEAAPLPWHSRYVVVVPGEFLQIASRNEIAAAVHRVVATKKARLSAPVLLRGRPGVPLNTRRYLGALNNALLKEVDGMQMQDLHNEMQDIQKALSK